MSIETIADDLGANRQNEGKKVPIKIVWTLPPRRRPYHVIASEPEERTVSIPIDQANHNDKLPNELT